MSGDATVIRPERLSHLVFRTLQLESMIDWYCAVLGAHVVFRSSSIAFLTYDEEHHRIALVAPESAALKTLEVSVGFYHAAFSYKDLATLLENYIRLKSRGIKPWRSILHGPTVSQYYKDPDGNDIELQVDAFENTHDATEWMKGESFRKNPVGIPFEPEGMISRLRAGECAQQLMQRPDA